MNFVRLVNLRLLVLLVALLTCTAASAQVERYLAGIHYLVVPSVPALQELQSLGDKTNVTEIFWYGCPHCYAFDPLLDAWVAKQGAAINFVRSPMVWTPISRQHAHIFFAARALGLGAELHKAIFDTIQTQHNNLVTEGAAEKFFADHGVAADKFAEAWNSFEVDAALRKHEAVMAALHVPSVPAILVNGKYLVHVHDAVPTHEAMLEVVEFLLHKKG